MIEYRTQLHKGKIILHKGFVLTIKILFGLVFLLPFYWALVTSIRPAEDVISDTINLIPTRVDWSNYIRVYTKGGLLKAIKNTVIMTTLGLLLNLSLCSLAGYAFARMKFKGRDVIFRIMMLGMMIPSIVTLLPSLLIIDVLNLYGKWLGVVLPGAAGMFNIFFLRQFFLTLPEELAESARIDGAGEFTIFFRIYLPLVKPALATIAIFTFQGNWNSFLWPYLILPSDQPVIATFVKNMEATGDYGLAMAASMLATIPIVIVFLLFQRYFIKGMSISGIKG